MPRRVERAAASRRLDDEHRVGQSGDDGVAREKLRRERVRAGFVRREHGPAGGADALGEFAVAPREEARVSPAQHADGRRSGVERALVSGGVDAEREPGDDAASGRSQVAREQPGEPSSVGRCRPRAHDRDTRVRQNLRIPGRP